MIVLMLLSVMSSSRDPYPNPPGPGARDEDINYPRRITAKEKSPTLATRKGIGSGSTAMEWDWLVSR